MAMICRTTSKHFDAILDCGATANIFPSSLEQHVSNIHYMSGTLTLGDKSQVPTYATCSYGVLSHVILCRDIAHTLISVGYLTKVLKLFVFYSYDRAYILKLKQSKDIKPLNYFSILATAEIKTMVSFT